MTLLQKPIGSPFTAGSTASDVLQGISLVGKTVLVTGGYSGIGLEAVRVLHAAGAKVVVPARDLNKAMYNLSGIPGVETDVMDLMNPVSINDFAHRFLARNPTLDILINCAGVMANPLTRDSRGYESQFSTNVLGHFQLTCALWPALSAAGKARVINLSSANHRVNVTELLHDPNFRAGEYDPWQAYARSKAANILMAVALDSIGSKNGVRAFSVHPGGIFDTGLARHMDKEIARAYGMIDENDNPVIDPEAGWKTPEQGASTMVWAATSPMLDGSGGLYLSNNEVASELAEDEGQLTNNGVAPGAINPVTAGRLWRLCEEMTGARID
ncbi:SDR family NAD(P)-dependent oxidoreductase [Klebsiella variicola]|uniref:SDR family NAD(P)-dependent oxidoreductase n=1 Tax=Klebsiella variicola TaxID=244366 RepID=UPI001C20F718|nr:SDR family NAD(P)-dependent oxidoreductase [Klebsiella variicola]MBU9731521.1 SDR family NAD(P)-dependent oxidoreductase [Klebsiella variicola]